MARDTHFLDVARGACRFARRARIAHPCAFGEIERDAPLRRLRHALDERPIGFAGLARAKGFAELRRCSPVFGDKQHAARVAVEPVHEHGAAIALRQGFQHAVDMPRRAGAALHGEAEGLVEHEHVLVLEQGHALELDQIVGAGASYRRGRGLVEPQGRHAHGLALFEPRRGFDPFAVDPHFALAANLGEMGQGERGKSPLEPAVEAHARLVLADDQRRNARAHGFGRNFAHGCGLHLRAKAPWGRQAAEKEGDRRMRAFTREVGLRHAFPICRTSRAIVKGGGQRP